MLYQLSYGAREARILAVLGFSQPFASTIKPRSGRPRKTVDVEFFCYHRDRPDSSALRDELLEAHWSYMDRFAAELIARGPTLDGDTPTGSVHIEGIDLPDPAAARAFAIDEPYYQAGAYRDVLLRRRRNALGRTMWDFAGGRTGGRPVPGAGHWVWCRPSTSLRGAARTS